MSEKIEVIGVRFKEVGKVYYFDPAALSCASRSRLDKRS